MKAKYLFATGLMASVSYTAMAADTTCAAVGGSLATGTCSINATAIDNELSVNADTVVIDTSNGSSALIQVKETSDSVYKLDDNLTDATALIVDTNASGGLSLLDGDDNLTLRGSNQNLTVNGPIDLGTGNNSLTVNSAIINGYVLGGASASGVGGVDTVNLVDSQIIATGSTDAIALSSGENRLTAISSTIVGNVVTGADADVINFGVSGNNTVVPIIAASGGSSLTGSVVTGGGNDVVNLYHTSSIDGSSALLGAVRLGDGDDNISLFDNSSVTGNIDGEGGDDRITVFDDAVVVGNLSGNVGDDRISVQGNAKVTGNISGGDGADIIAIQAGATQNGAPEVVGNIFAGSGNDNLSVTQNGKLTGSAFMLDGDDAVFVTATLDGNVDTGTGADIVRVAGSGAGAGTITGNVVAGAGDDQVIAYLDGKIQGRIDGGAGLDILQLGFSEAVIHAPVIGEADLGADNDMVLAFSRSSATKIDTNAGNDKVYLFDETQVGELLGGDGNDLITLGVTSYAVADGKVSQDAADNVHTTSSATVGRLDAGEGDDIVELAMQTSVTGDLIAGGGLDKVSLTDTARANNVDMGNDDDELIASLESKITGLTQLGAGNDTMLVQNNATTGIVVAGAGDDTITIQDSGAISAIDSGDGNDIITLTDSALIGGSSGSAGTISAVTEGATDTGTGDDVMTVSDSSSIGAVNMGDGSDNLILNGDQITLRGTLDGGDDTQEADGFIDRLTFRDWNADLPGVDYVNWEYITLDNSNLNVTDKREINVGTLEVNGNSSLKLNTSNPDDFKVTGNLSNEGTIDMSNGAVGGGLTVTGDYKGSGTLIMDVNLGTEQADQLVVGGDVDARGRIDFKRVGADTDGNGGKIKVIDAVNDDKSTTSTFVFDSTVQGSARSWTLLDESDGFYIGYQPDPEIPVVVPPPPEIPVLVEVPALVVLPTVARDLTDLRNKHDRLGEIRRLEGWVGVGPHSLATHMGTEWSNIYSYIPRDFNVWVKGVMGGSQTEGKRGYAYDGMYGGADAGADVKLVLGSHDVVYAGVFGGYRDGRYTTDGTTEVQGWADTPGQRDADIDISSWQVGGYATYLWRRTSFIDLVVQYADISADISTDAFETVNGNATTRYMAYNGSADGEAFSASAEFGHRVDLDDDLILEPQVQLIYTHMRWDDMNRMENGSTLYTASYEDMNYLTTRIGFRLEKTFELSENAEFKPWFRASYLQEIGDTPSITIGSDKYTAYDLDAYAEFNLGATYVVSDTVQLNAGVNYRSDFRDWQSYDGNLGVRISW